MTSAMRFRTLLIIPASLVSVCVSMAPTYAQQPASVHSDSYKKWLDEDVRWIITDQERADFKNRSTDQQRDEFVVGFWDRRNPSPGATENTFKEEHYRRLTYANQHFAAGIPGWNTDRGRFYIMYGAPDKIVRQWRSGSSQPRSIYHNGFNSEMSRWIYFDDLGRVVRQPDKPQANGIQKSDFNSEEWYWRYIEGLGRDVTIKFVDTCGCGEYHMLVEKDESRKYRPK